MLISIRRVHRSAPASPEWEFPRCRPCRFVSSHISTQKLGRHWETFSEVGGLEGGRLFQEVPSLQGLIPSKAFSSKNTGYGSPR